MERVYRWVAAIHMAYDRPITGFGPNGFVPHYKNYTVFLFETWISENEERSGVHNYFLMTIVEQGFFGLVVLFGLFVSFFLFTEKKYHQSNNTSHKKIYLAAFLAMIALVISSLFSDLLEVDKIGSLFFILLSLVILVSRNFKGLMQESKV
jgi:O-antigen ligase